jgi:hypothetical protein
MKFQYFWMPANKRKPKWATLTGFEKSVWHTQTLCFRAFRTGSRKQSVSLTGIGTDVCKCDGFAVLKRKCPVSGSLFDTDNLCDFELFSVAFCCSLLRWLIRVCWHE